MKDQIRYLNPHSHKGSEAAGPVSYAAGPLARCGLRGPHTGLFSRQPLGGVLYAIQISLLFNDIINGITWKQSNTFIYRPLDQDSFNYAILRKL